MNMIDYYKKVVFENYANFKGRASRSEYWYFNLMSLIISATFALINLLLKSTMGVTSFGMVGSIYTLAIFLPGMAVSVRRLHDVGKSGWLLLLWYLVMTVGMAALLFGMLGSFFAAPSFTIDNMWIFALIGLALTGVFIYVFVLFCTKSDEGNNKYGPNPFDTESELDLLGTE